MQSIGGFTVCYELATPITYQLTPQQLALFKGINNISTNAKTVQVTYRNGELATTGDIVASTEVAKQNAIGESASYTDAKLATALAPILGNFATAETSPTSASHAVGEYLLYNNRLYKVLAAISVGQQLTIGTNIGQTNVAAELASLNGFHRVISGVLQTSNNFTTTFTIESESLYMVICGSRNATALDQAGCYIVMAYGDTRKVLTVQEYTQYPMSCTFTDNLTVTLARASGETWNAYKNYIVTKIA